MESQGLRYLLEEFPDFLTRYTPEEHAFIERCQEGRWKQEDQDDWRGSTHKETGSGDLVVMLGEISNEVTWIRSAVPPPAQSADGCW
jgi:hypothetical protein